MGGCRCSYKNCVRATKNSEKDFHFFHYPVRDPERCLKWINNAKKSNFQHLPEEQLRNKVVCQLHFEEHYFSNASRKRLVHNAIPTLDAGSEEPVKNEEINLQVLPSDSEGNVFTVDTENFMQTGVRDVTSYVIQNGNLIPADLSNTEILKPIMYHIVGDRIVDVENNLELNNMDDLVDQVGRNVFIDEREPWPEELNIRFNCNESVMPINDSQNPLHLDEEKTTTNNYHDYVKTIKPRVQNNSKENSNAMEVVNLSKTIQQHSKEIASLKRILNSKMKRVRNRKRLTNMQIINNLRGLIPATLHGAVSLHLLKKNNNFTKDEKNFLIALYKASPATYDILLKDCRWKLPDSDTVKKLILNRNYVR